MSGTDKKITFSNRFLLVDDDDDVISVWKQAFEAEFGKKRVLTCSTGKAANNLFDEHRPAVLILDMMIPSPNGFLVLERVKKMKDASGRAAMVIMVTADEGKRHQAYAEHLGVDHYMLKPVRINLLVRKAEEFMKSMF